MGLDMYLYKKTYVKNWDHNDKKDHYEITIKKGDRKSTRLNSSHSQQSRMPSSA